MSREPWFVVLRDQFAFIAREAGGDNDRHRISAAAERGQEYVDERPDFVSVAEMEDHLRFAIDVLEMAAPSREEDLGHYANRALSYLYAIREHITLAEQSQGKP